MLAALIGVTGFYSYALQFLPTFIGIYKVLIKHNSLLVRVVLCFVSNGLRAPISVETENKYTKECAIIIIVFFSSHSDYHYSQLV